MNETRESLEDQLSDLEATRANLVAQKSAIDAELSAITNEFRTGGRMRDEQYRRLCQKQTDAKRTAAMLQGQVSETNARIDRIRDLLERVNRERSDKAERSKTLRALIFELSEKYRQFSADSSRVSSMRRMAAEFSIELQNVLDFRETK